MSCFSFFSPKSSQSKNNPTYFIIIIVAFTQGFSIYHLSLFKLSSFIGVLGLADLSISYLYKDDFKLTPAQVSICTGLTSLPWIIKPFWGVISDSYHFCGYRRKSYLILFGFLECFCWCSLASWVRAPVQGLVILICVQVAVSFCNVIGEALLVEVSRESSNTECVENESSK